MRPKKCHLYTSSLRRLSLIALSRLVGTQVIELSLEALLGPSDKAFDLHSEECCIGRRGLLRRNTGSAAFFKGRIYAVKLGGFDVPLASFVLRADDLAALDCL